MNHLYSLYDALVSIDAPSDKARAVVDAMERDMTTLLASKHDVAEMRLQTESRFMQLDQKIEMLRLSVTKDIEALLDFALDRMRRQAAATHGDARDMKLDSFQAIVLALENAGVRFLIAGGLAAIAHGFLRFTKDVDTSRIFA